MRTVLILTGRYLPGFRDGGPVRSILNLTEWLGDECDIRIMCLDRDHGDTCAYPDIKEYGYNKVGKAKVWYTERFTDDAVERLAADADTVYCCGPYNDYARIAMRLKKKGKIKAPLYVASMGSFSPEAFKIKGFKKRLFITYMKLTGMFKNVVFSVTSSREEKELKAVVGKDKKCIIATDLPRRGIVKHTAYKEPGKLRLVFVSRISRKKNLAAIPDIIRSTGKADDISIDIYGTPEDEAYLRECIESFEKLKESFAGFCFEYKGEADSEKVRDIFADHDAFIFPTLGENYGHVIAESLSSGCIPVISDQTPWLDFDEKNCGFVCTLGESKAFADAVARLCETDEAGFAGMRDNCYRYIESVNEDSVKNSGFRTIFCRE
ncbi:MAG: glycosyltransferase family 4 protein [Lachnospiraceae bacterium]|nr:glycosyltransferase family 4 protein [Lachnospiraceae bacterium]